MQRLTYDLMREQVRAIFQAFTGRPLTETDPGRSAPLGHSPEELVLRRFAELEALTRLAPASHAVPTFGFSPRLEVLERDGDLIVNVPMHGVRREDVHVEVTGTLLVIAGIRVGEMDSLARYHLAEIPRGPFRRVVQLPAEVSTTPRVEVANGLIRIVLSKHALGAVAQA
jgi:HSP20 family molecular chaperone IbpA